MRVLLAWHSLYKVTWSASVHGGRSTHSVALWRAVVDVEHGVQVSDPGAEEKWSRPQAEHSEALAEDLNPAGHGVHASSW